MLKKVFAYNWDIKDLVKDAIEKYGPNCDLNFIDVSGVENMGELFAGSEFNGDISKWNVSNVTNMNRMFSNSEFNGNISKWRVSKFADVVGMFEGCPLEKNPPSWFWDIHYKSDFIDFAPEKYDKTKILFDENILHVQYYLKGSTELIGELIVDIDSNVVKKVWQEERIRQSLIRREEFFLSSGRLDNRRLLIFEEHSPDYKPTHFCYEKYKDGKMMLFATSICDPSISNGEGSYVRYIYSNGRVSAKEVFNGSGFRYGFLSKYDSVKRVPYKMIYCDGGNLAVRYTDGNSFVKKETNFIRTQMRYMIIENRIDSDKFVDVNSSQVNYIPSNQQKNLLDDSLCKISLQCNEYLNAPIENPQPDMRQNKQTENNKEFEYDVAADQIGEMLKSIEFKKDCFYTIKVHGLLILISEKECECMFSHAFSSENVSVNLDMSDCKIVNPEYLCFRNCPSLTRLAFPRSYVHLKNGTIVNCRRLWCVTMPKSIMIVDEGAFDGCRPFCFYLNAYIEDLDLMYSSRDLKNKSYYEIQSKNDLDYPIQNEYGLSQFDNLGYISLPKPFVNGIVLTEYGKRFQEKSGLSPYELKLLLDEQICLVDNVFVSKEFSDTFGPDDKKPLTGADALVCIMGKKSIGHLYMNLIIKEVPVIPYNWRASYYFKGAHQNPYINILYSDLLGKINDMEKTRIDGLSRIYSRDIQRTIIRIAQEKTYQSAFWYLRKTRFLG